MKNKYSEFGDSYINILVVERLGKKLSRNARIQRIGDHSVLLEDDTYFDFNNPSDAWLIIVENKISISALPNNYWRARAVKFIDAISVNPLRAAMIVFLMMSEGKYVN
ncbi:hypothetical protein B5C26_19295 [Photorhabdus luminescens]|uniref:phage protein NinX family protein n=1 Tax=Photorhabdus luminescens TaxID=29488 RepID=UPI000B4C9D74|nr:phage protein NinX family protein [Photorhabdus luminescens]OWO80041.1 hypothetical protein B5C26_19295 [Photorhabdus luminescens]